MGEVLGRMVLFILVFGDDSINGSDEEDADVVIRQPLEWEYTNARSAGVSPEPQTHTGSGSVKLD
jgi:hypothetical protein